MIEDLVWFYCSEHVHVSHSAWKDHLMLALLDEINFQTEQPEDLLDVEIDFWVPSFTEQVAKLVLSLDEVTRPTYQQGQLYHYSMDLLQMLAVMDTFGCPNYFFGEQSSPCSSVSLRKELI